MDFRIPDDPTRPPDDPTPEEIATACWRIRQGWDHKERLARACHQARRGHLFILPAEPREWMPPIIAVADIEAAE